MIGLHVPVIPPTTNEDLKNVWINPLTSKYLTLSNAARSPQWKLVPGGIQRPFLLLFPQILPTEIPKKNITATSLFIVVALLDMICCLRKLLSCQSCEMFSTYTVNKYKQTKFTVNINIVQCSVQTVSSSSRV